VRDEPAGDGTNGKRRTKNEERKTKNEKRRTKNEYSNTRDAVLYSLVVLRFSLTSCSSFFALLYRK